MDPIVITSSPLRDLDSELNIKLEIDVLDEDDENGSGSGNGSDEIDSVMIGDMIGNHSSSSVLTENDRPRSLVIGGSQPHSVLIGSRNASSPFVIGSSSSNNSLVIGSNPFVIGNHSSDLSLIMENNDPAESIYIKDEVPEEFEDEDEDDFAEDVNEKSDDDESFQCFYCTFVCHQKEALSKHIEKEHSRKNSTSSISPQKEKNGIRINPAATIKPPVRTSTVLITCKLCSYSSYSQVEVDSHFGEYHSDPSKVFPKEMFHCSECRYTSQVRRAYICHYERLHMQVSFYSCEFCKFNSSNASARNKHLEDVHKHCSMCDFHTEEATIMEQHVMQEHSKKKGHMCTYCEKILPTMEKLDDHVNNTHVQPTKQSFKCIECDFTCKMSYDYYDHLSSKHRQELFQCEKCDFSSHLAWQMADHDGTHNIKGYACDKCEYMTTRIMFLRRHIKARHSEKNECCPYCPFKSSQRWCVTQHIIQVHEKSRLFPCEQCDYKATSRGNLNVHIRGVHIRDRRYGCTECSFKTSLKAGLIKHLKSHKRKSQSKKPLVIKCKSCDYKANSKSAMIMHRRDNHPFRCEFCDFLTGSLVDFQGHLKARHQEQVEKVVMEEEAEEGQKK